MKRKLLFILFGIGITCAIKAQIQKGSIIVGGNVSYSRYGASSSGFIDDNNNQKYLLVSPSIGKVIKDNVVLGAELTYGHSKVKNGTNNQVGKTFGVGLFMRRYLELGKRFYLFGQGKIGAVHNSQLMTSTNNSSDTRGISIGFGIYPGISYQLSSRCQFEMGLNDLVFSNYSHTKQIQKANGTTTSESKSNNFSIATISAGSSNLVFGFRFLF